MLGGGVGDEARSTFVVVPVVGRAGLSSQFSCDPRGGGRLSLWRE